MKLIGRIAILCVLLGAFARGASAQTFPAPRLDYRLARAAASQTVVLAGGCFWGVQAVFQHVRGVTSAVSGYSGGSAANAHYEIVCTGSTGHAESVRVTFDPSKVTFGTILRIFFSVAHDPTELDRQGPDTGNQYRSVIFVTDRKEEKIARAYIAQLDGEKVFPSPIATRVVPLKAFYPAEAYHQNFAALHPDYPYIVINDAPKVARLRQMFPSLYKEN